MESFRRVIGRILAHNVWCRFWYCDGMIVCATPTRAFEVKSLDDPAPTNLHAVGCGGWYPDGLLDWAGIDLDIGHGSTHYTSFDDAVRDAQHARDLVCGAAEIRRSKSGKGLHVRVRLGRGITDGRTIAPRIARWIATQANLRADASPLGRQNLWFWTAQPQPSAFELIEPCEGEWTPPPEALAPPPTPALTPHSMPKSCLSRRTKDFIANGASQGERNHRLFIAACDTAGCNIPHDQSIALLLPAALRSGTPEHEARRTIHSAYSKPRNPALTHVNHSPRQPHNTAMPHDQRDNHGETTTKNNA